MRIVEHNNGFGKKRILQWARALWAIRAHWLRLGAIRLFRHPLLCLLASSVCFGCPRASCPLCLLRVHIYAPRLTRCTG